jgi:peptide/nickel transport system permease protein
LVAFLIRRVLQSIVVLVIVTMITFALLRMIPGNVAVAVMGPGAYRNPEAIRLFNSEYGFNLPWYRQYLLWLGHLARGNLGYSWTLNQSVASLLAISQDNRPGRAVDHLGTRLRHSHRAHPSGAP